MSYTLRTLRQIAAVLQPLTGDRATATVRIVSTAPSVPVPKGTYLYPIHRSDAGSDMLRPALVFRTLADVVATPAGVDAAIHSVVGGLAHNAPAGTVFRFSPPRAALSPDVVATTAVAGATKLDGPCGVREIHVFEQLSAGGVQAQLFFSKLSAFPAIVLVWEATGAAQDIGPNVRLRPDRWTAHIVVSRLDSGELRANDGLEIMDAVETLLGRRAHVDGVAFTSADVEIVGRARLAIADSTYVYSVSFQTWSGVPRRDDRAVQAWLRTSYTVKTTPPDEALDPTVVTLVDGATYDQTP